MLPTFADATLAGLSMDFAANPAIQSLTLYLFFAGTVAMGAGALYFFLERSSVPPVFRSTLTVSGLVCAIACFHYYKMTSQYMTGASFPTALRYVDWLFTTPLLLIKFPMLLQLGETKRGAGSGRYGSLFAQLVLLDVAMIVTAFIAETSSTGSPSWWTFFLVACGFELAIVAILYARLGTAIASAPRQIGEALSVMRLFILIGWAVYPVGFLMALGGAGEYREIVYNVADVINKVGFGLVALHGIKTYLAVEHPGIQPLAAAV